MSMSFHSVSSQHENSHCDALLEEGITSSHSVPSGGDALQNEVEPTTHDQFEPNGSNLRSRSGHPAPLLEDTVSIYSCQCGDGPGDHEVHDEVDRTSEYPLLSHIHPGPWSSRDALLERAISFLERTASFRSFSHFEDDGRGALYDEAGQETERLAPGFQAVIISTTRKTVLVALLFILAFSVKDSCLLQLTDHLVFAVESGVHILMGAYLRQRGIEEREVLRCMGTGGTMFYALMFLKDDDFILVDYATNHNRFEFSMTY
ncbi:hypothetical protein F4604DRAFT_1932576 [Suillus subluteus]|nr:hypothetical protein F4604DRAFT_1932576 [Suillus subluteus]